MQRGKIIPQASALIERTDQEETYKGRFEKEEAEDVYLVDCDDGSSVASKRTEIQFYIRVQ